jgi:enolase
LLALDPAASEFYDGKSTSSKKRQTKTDERSDGRVLERLVRKYPIISIEDGMAENDWTVGNS